MMKRGIIVAIFLFGVTVGYGQDSYYDLENTRKIREYMVMDGGNPNHIRAQQQSLNRLTFGLAAPDEKGEGVYELRGSCIWLVESIYGNDRPVAHLVNDEGTGILMFVRTETDDCSIEGEHTEIIGALDINLGDVYIGDNKNESFAIVDTSGEILANSGKTLLRMDKADKRLVVLYLLEYYLPTYAPEMISSNL